ncbi:hypothetical protein FJU08_01295 [Martelella alba]|uniref:Uncharacterized protein n=1 Tax=Martelella alba TaxID=2590451 RepID=A0A506UIV0_9HYPH|nr:hypothetical protein [Martelella alba]TPW33228.1 hypothetical protein FJU08_01295 [Martelella alba]
MVRAAVTALKAIRIAVAASPLLSRRQQVVETYLLVTVCNVTGATAASALGCTKQNVSKHQRTVERLRENTAFDQALSEIETAMLGE